MKKINREIEKLNVDPDYEYIDSIENEENENNIEAERSLQKKIKKMKMQ